MIKALHATVRGKVQGVGFRWFVRETARSLGVAGTVRNLPDGSVEIVAEGESGALDSLMARVAQGPPGARVAGVERRDSEPGGRIRGFEVTF